VAARRRRPNLLRAMVHARHPRLCPVVWLSLPPRVEARAVRCRLRDPTGMPLGLAAVVAAVVGVVAGVAAAMVVRRWKAWEVEQCRVQRRTPWLWAAPLATASPGRLRWEPSVSGVATTATVVVGVGVRVRVRERKREQ